MLDDLRLRLRALFLRRRSEEELHDELRFHLEREAEKYGHAGIAPGEALRSAHLALGGLEQVKEDCRDARGLSWVDTSLQDCRYAFRMLRKSPAFAIVAVLTLALGIGANTAIFSVVEGVLLKPLPYPHAEQLVSVEIAPLALDPTVRGIAPEDYFIFREQARSFQDIGIYGETDSDRDVNVTSFAEPERVHALHATHDVLSALAVPPLLGRVFSAADDAPSAAATVVLTYAYWERRFSSDPAAVGKTLVIDGVAREIIGVLPRNFRFLDLQDLAFILPLQLDRNQIRLGQFAYFGLGRLKPGVTSAQAVADTARLLPVTFHAFPAEPGLTIAQLESARLTPIIVPLKEDVVGNVSSLLWVLMGGIGMVLLIACANVANLLLVRTEGRRHELALRVALGAHRRRIAGQLLRESAVLGLLGGVAGLGLTWAALRLLLRLAPAGLPRLENIGIDLPVLLFTLALALFTSVLFGLIPVLKHLRGGVAGPANTRGATAGRERHRAQHLLVGLQVALALVLLVCSGLMIRTFRMLTHVNPGFDPRGVQTFRVFLPPTDVADDALVPRVEQQILDKLAAIPGVASASFSNTVPLDGSSTYDNVFAEDHMAEEQRTVPPLRRFMFASPEYRATLGIPLLAGRDLSWSDTYNRVPVALVSASYARELWGSPAAALGKRVRTTFSTEWREVVGVVGDVRDDGLDKPVRAAVFFPPLMANYRGNRVRVTRAATFAVRSPLAGTDQFVRQVQQAVWAVDAKAPLARVRTLDHLYQQSLARTSFTLVMLAIAAAMALLLGAVGLYGVIAYTVSQRTREIGVRMALGAQRESILAMVVGGGMAIIGAGLAVGLASALLLTRLLTSLLFGVRPYDPLTYAIVVPVLAIVAFVACYLPARRAARIEPMVALRYE